MIENQKGFEKIEEIAYGIDSRYTSDEKSIADGKALMEARVQRMKNLSRAKIMGAKLLQLKLRMEEYIKKPVHENNNFFTEVLTLYIDTIYNKRNIFAKDIGIKPTRLSQILNNHRKPNDEFMRRLMIHSEKIYKNICLFHKKIWYTVYYHEKIYNIMSSQKEWRATAEKQVNISKGIAI